ncbi:PMR5 N-terminal domain [Macleaya cordata]|uniref:PMR5 N-terminal domain n=1 Tax=Macleaya cordata TaxID=56857 RepID=A0A200PUN3_MACCD|nr:PMR5 N-terminal domain [Macleaya cordata]
MVKQRRCDWNPWSLFKQNHLYVKFAVSILLMGLAFRLFYSNNNNSIRVSPVSESPFVEKTVGENSTAPASNSVDVQENSDQIPQKETCDLSTGDWIPDPSGPIYTNESCRVITAHQNCMKNGRPDSGYLYWRWKPQDCELPRFNAERFLDFMQNKSWAFVGDSIARNHVQSLLCILSKVEAANEVYHDEDYRSRKWYFPSYNFSLSVIWSPFLVKAAIFEDMNGVSTADVQLHLDELDKKWTDQYKSFDYMVISGGKWFLKTAIYYENNTIAGCHYCPGKNLTEYGFENAYRRALKLALNFFITSNHRSVVLYRTTTPDHFENGEWFNGGTCDRTVPFKGETSLKDIDTTLRNIELEEFKKLVTVRSEKRVNLKLLDTTLLSLLRPDGHPGPYRQFHPFSKDKNAKVQYDCLHWCLPGPIDSWNDLVMEMVMNG